MNQIEMNTRAREETMKWVEKAFQVYGPIRLGKMIRLPVHVSFDLRGRAAGMAYTGTHLIQYNATLLYHNFETFLQRTIVHEVAHIVARCLYPLCSDHGREWKSVMRSLGARDISRCHSYDISVAVRGFSYHCLCKDDIILSPIQHKRTQRGVQYKCTHCKAFLIPGKREGVWKEGEPLIRK